MSPRSIAVVLLAATVAVLSWLAPSLARRSGAVDQAPPVLLAADGTWDDWDDYTRTLLQMQRESIAAQEEQAREAGRALRRNELEKEREKDAAEREAYFDAVLEASQASLRAPRGVYYRKPGHRSADPPPEGALGIDVGSLRYIYDKGIFWLQQGTEYIVVTAPVGAVVDALPRGAVQVPGRDGPVWYFFGTFFAARGGEYTVVAPPAGLAVHYLPDGYTREKVGGVDVYRFGDTLFKPVFVQGILLYQVVAAP